MFPGMEFIPLIAVGIAVLVLFAFTVAFSLLLNGVFPGRKTRMRVIGASISGVLFLAYLVWFTRFVSPLKLPSSAKDIRIDCANPFTLAIDDNLRFQVSQNEFRAWIETLCQMPWESIRTNSQAIQFEAVVDGRYATSAKDFEGRTHIGEDFQPPGTFKKVPWLDLRGLKNGYWIRGSRFFGGDLLYDLDSERVYYRCWD